MVMSIVKETDMEEESLATLMAHTMTVTGKMARDMEMVNINNLMVPFTKDNGQTI